MPLTAKGEKIKGAMEEEYGAEKGEEVFYASANKGTITGVHDAQETTARLGNIFDSISHLASRFDSFFGKRRSDANPDEYEWFVAVHENGMRSRKFKTQREAVAEAKKTPGAWVESLGGPYDGQVAWQPRD